MDPFTIPTLTAVLGRMLPEPQAGLLAGILFGIKASLSRPLTDAFITTGTIHIIALSGQNVSIVAVLMATLLTPLFSRRIASLLTLLALAWFLWFAGPSPSLVRAVIMGCLSLFAVIFGRRNLSLLGLALAVSTMLLLNPPWITDLGFQLSVLATLGIILFGGKIEHGTWYALNQQARGAGVRIPDTSFRATTSTSFSVNSGSRGISGKIPPRSAGWRIGRNDSYNVLFVLIRGGYSFLIRVIQDDLRLTLAAQLFTTPLIFLSFHRLSLIAPLTNVLIGWTMPFIMGLGWAAAIGGYFWLPLGLLPAWAAWVFLTYVIGAVEITAGIPMASVGW